ncbi:MAG: hypothetical protein C0616_02515 [Desulfuromonas sp.]|nr:MAG: hypothetical protein C0616_02515 [Desulfuromonas sp.]
MTDRRRQVLVVMPQGGQKPLLELLQQEQFEVRLGETTDKGLESALERPPDVMIVDTVLGKDLVESLTQTLLANPRTEKIAFFFIGGEGEELSSFRRHKDQFFIRPFNAEQLLSGLLNYFRQKEQTQQVGLPDQDVSGDLTHISLVDLLQVMNLNRRDGTLTLTRGTDKGEVFLLGGQVVEAKLGQVAGEKAFFRLLTWFEGNFQFRHGEVPVEPRITIPTDHLILDGVRQNDEMNAQRDSLPAPSSEVVLLVPQEHLPSGLRPTTQEILLLLQNMRKVQDVLDHGSRPDFEILQILRALLDKGILSTRERGQDVANRVEPLLSTEDVLVVKDSFGESDALLQEATAKLVLLVARGEELRGLVQVLQAMPEFEADVSLAGSRRELLFGDIGQLQVADTLKIRLFSLPATDETAPLWRPFCRRLFGVLSIGEEGLVSEAEQFFEQYGNVEVVKVGFNEMREGTLLLRAGDRDAWRQVLHRFAANLGERRRRQGSQNDKRTETETV